MAASTTQAPDRGWHRAPGTRRCGYHHIPMAACELIAATCPNDGLVFIPGVDGELDPSACLCPVCTAAVA